MHINIKKKLFDIETNKECSICLDGYEFETCDFLECSHGFHEKCIKTWLNEKNKCPLCNEKICNNITTDVLKNEYILYMETLLHDNSLQTDEILLYSTDNNFTNIIKEILICNYSFGFDLYTILECIEDCIINNKEQLFEIFVDYINDLEYNFELTISNNIIKNAIDNNYINILRLLMGSDLYCSLNKNSINDILKLNNIDLIDLHIDRIFERGTGDYTENYYLEMIESIFNNVENFIKNIIIHDTINYNVSPYFWKDILNNKNITDKTKNYIIEEIPSII